LATFVLSNQNSLSQRFNVIGQVRYFLQY
jgi:hypothetical protein